MVRLRSTDLFLAVGLAVLLVSASSAAAFSLTLDVVVVLDRTSYEPGDFVNATVYVIDGGTLTDADSVSLLVTSSGYSSWTESVPVIRLAGGTYRGTFPVPQNLTGFGFPGMSLQAHASVGFLSDADAVMVSIPAFAMLRADVSLSTYVASRGDLVSGTMHVYIDGQLQDADGVNVSAHTYTGPLDSRTTYLPTANLSVGTYGFSYRVPSDLNQSVPVVFWATATVVRGLNRSSFMTSAPLQVDVANPFILWYHQIALSTRYADVDMWVADPLGTPVADATVALSAFGTWGGPPVVSLRAATDAQGRAPFNLTLNYSATPPSLTFWGYVEQGTANQSFVGALTAVPTQNPPFIGFSVRRNNILDNYAPGETAVLNYTGFSLGVPLNGTEIFYDVHNLTTLIAYGRVVLDRSGNFTLRFPMPASAASIDFSAQMPNGGWSTTDDAVSAAIPLDIQRGPFQVGATTSVTGQLPEAGAPWLVTVSLYPYNLSEYPVLRADWSPAEASTTFLYTAGTRIVNGSTLDLSFTLPSYLPHDRDYWFQIVAYPMNPALPAGTWPGPYMVTELVHVTQASGGPGGALSTLAGALLVLLAVSVPVAILVLLLRRRRGPPSAAPSPTMAPPSGPGKEPPGPPPAG